MILGRVTGQNALTLFDQLLRELERWLRDAGPLGTVSDPSDDLRLLQQSFQRRVLLVDVVLAFQESLSTSLLLDLLRLQLGFHEVASGQGFLDLRSGPPQRNLLRIMPWTPLRLPVLKAGDARSPVLIVESKVFADPAMYEQMEPIAENRPLLFILRSDSDPGSQGNLGTLGAWATEELDLDVPLAKSSLLRKLGSDQVLADDLLLASSLSSTLQSFISGCGLAVEAELRAQRVKRALLQQRVAKLQQRGNLQSSTEFTTEIRGALAASFPDFERGCLERCQNLLLSPIGTLWNDIEPQLSKIQVSQDKKAKNIIFRVSEQSELAINHMVRSRIETHCRQDLVAMRDLFRITSKNLDNICTKDGALLTQIHFQPLSADRIARLLDTQLTTSRQYKNEIRKSGIFEILMVARRPQFILTMAMSLVGGVFGLSYLHEYASVIAAASVALLIVGTIFAIRGAKADKHWVEIREIERVQDHYRSEFRRAFSDILRAWPQIISQHLVEQSGAVIAQPEGAFRDYWASKNAEVAEEKQKLQRSLQVLEMTERRLQAASKAREGLVNSLSQMEGELRQLFLSSATRRSTE